MGLSDLIHRLASRQPACYLVEAPGGEETRWAVEAALDGLDWPCVAAPGHADVLLVAGVLPEELHPAAQLLWSQLSGPRVRLGLADPAEVDDALARLPQLLAAADAHDRDGAGRPDEVQPWLASDEDHEHHQEDEEDEHGGHDHGEPDHEEGGEHGGHDMHEHGEHGGGGHDMQGGHDMHDHGGHEMSPSGIALAGGAEDRDGLEMDQLVHPWGPLLHRWPGGLELRLTLHGDVVADADARWYGETSTPRPTVTRGWDAVATTLSLIGDGRHARTARALRGGIGEPGDPAVLGRRLRLLRRWRSLPDRAAAALLDLVEDPEPGRAAGVDPAALVRGHDLADARLLLAAHSPLLSRVPHAPAARADHDHGEGAHG